MRRIKKTFKSYANFKRKSGNYNTGPPEMALLQRISVHSNFIHYFTIKLIKKL